jgi:hypothetical protein
MNMKLNPNSTRPQISNYVHPWDTYVAKLNKPKPPTQEAIEKAKFVDKTYVWDGGNGSIRPRNKRSTQ